MTHFPEKQFPERVKFMFSFVGPLLLKLSFRVMLIICSLKLFWNLYVGIFIKNVLFLWVVGNKTFQKKFSVKWVIPGNDFPRNGPFRERIFPEIGYSGKCFLGYVFLGNDSPAIVMEPSTMYWWGFVYVRRWSDTFKYALINHFQFLMFNKEDIWGG